MNGPSISVLIPVYNGARFLRQAIESALAQTLAPVEVIVIDDGSTDGTPEIATSFGHRIRYVRQANQGPSAARNLGARMAAGDWIAFLDADDYWRPDKLQKQAAVVEADPAVGLVYTGRTELLPDNTSYDVPAHSPGGVMKRQRYENPIFPSTVLVRRSLLLDHPWPEHFRSTEDWWMFYVLSRHTKMASIPESTTFYRLNPQSLTHTHWQKVLEQASIVAEEIQRDFSGLQRALIHRRVNGRLYANAAIAAREQGSQEYLPYIVRSLMEWPVPEDGFKRYKLVAKMLIQHLQYRAGRTMPAAR